MKNWVEDLQQLRGRIGSATDPRDGSDDAEGDRRLLGHPYNTSANCTLYTFAKFSAGGRYVLFTSNMDGSARSDLFLAELPAR